MEGTELTLFLFSLGVLSPVPFRVRGFPNSRGNSPVAFSKINSSNRVRASPRSRGFGHGALDVIDRLKIMSLPGPGEESCLLATQMTAGHAGAGDTRGPSNVFYGVRGEKKKHDAACGRDAKHRGTLPFEHQETVEGISLATIDNGTSRLGIDRLRKKQFFQQSRNHRALPRENYYPPPRKPTHSQS